MKTLDKINKYITENKTENKKVFNEYKQLQKEADGFLNSIKIHLRNHQNRFFKSSEMNMEYRNELEDVVDELRRISKTLK